MLLLTEIAGESEVGQEGAALGRPIQRSAAHASTDAQFCAMTSRYDKAAHVVVGILIAAAGWRTN